VLYIITALIKMILRHSGHAFSEVLSLEFIDLKVKRDPISLISN